ncbi:MAG: hypothetical protein IJQ89_00335 [Bacteroidales bacterium]|nr:hypothetical protein [Bacteroidales bacterium]
MAKKLYVHQLTSAFNALKFIVLVFVFALSANIAKAQDDNALNEARKQQQQAAREAQEARINYAEDSAAMAKRIKTLQTMLANAQAQLAETKSSSDSIAKMKQIIAKQLQTVEGLRKSLRSNVRLKDSLLSANSELVRQLDEKNNQLIEKVRQLQAMEMRVVRSESTYRDSMGNTRVETTRLEGLIKAQEVNIEAKKREVEYLRRELSMRDTEIFNQKANYRRVRDDRDHYLHLSDSLRNKLMDVEKIIIQKDEELKYTKKRAEDAEAKINSATNKKKKVRVIQGIAMRFYRTPDWYIRPSKNADGVVEYLITNKNSGNVEFDFITGASVMLWDLTPYFHKKHKETQPGQGVNFKRFDQDFTYDLGIYVGFGGSNLFKNFYFGPSFKFMDFFHFTLGANVAEYQVLAGDYKEGDPLPSGFSIKDQIVDKWKVNFFLSLSLDLDFLSYIKK